MDEKEQCRRPTGELGRKVLDGMNSHHVPLWNEALSRMPEHAGSVLDIGCGGGGFLRKLRGRYPGAELHGIDISEDAVAMTSETNAGDERLQLRVASVESLPFGDGSFDAVTAMETYFFWPDAEQGLREASRVLSPGGTLVVASEVGLGGDDEEDVLGICEEYGMTLLPDDEIIRIMDDAGLDAEAFRTDPGVVYIGKKRSA